MIMTTAFGGIAGDDGAVGNGNGNGNGKDPGRSRLVEQIALGLTSVVPAPRVVNGRPIDPNDLAQRDKAELALNAELNEFAELYVKDVRGGCRVRV